MNHQSILVIDDEPDNFDVIEILLSAYEYEFHYASNGQDAIDQLETFHPDLILLDVMMPGIDGIEVCQKIKAMRQWQAVPIIMVTALNSKADLARCLAAGADDFISKPLDAIELRARVRSMLRIKHQYDELQTLLKLREDMVNMIVHDLRNPLNTILLGLELLESVEYSREKQKYKLSQVYDSAQTLQSLVNDLLKIALIESGKVFLNRSEVELSELIKSVTANFEAIATKHHQVLVCQIPEHSPKKSWIDATMIGRALENLLSNAIKFSPPKSQIIINLEYLPTGNAKIQVIDSGPGVEESLQEKIFEKYEIGNRMTDLPQIGLGLAFCKMVIEAHEGKIGVKNNAPTGSIFEVTLPV